MTTYLIDFENTSYHGFEGYEKLDGGDTVVVFLGAKSAGAGIPVELVKTMTGLGKRATVLWKQSTRTAKNYLDMQLATYLGSLIGNPTIDEKNFVIVSKDQDFQAVLDYWENRRRTTTIEIRPTIAARVEAPASASPASAHAPMPPKAPAAKATLTKRPPTARASETTKKAVRAAVKDLELKPAHYTVIYNSLALATSLQELHIRLTQELRPRGLRSTRR
ncbi:PIN domain-containing protein [Leucobacter soli]|uniref:PIN domain-containing protein n=1 Tax=Leucobacter soli TaxID=2812850 RepID=UPI00360D211C